MSKVVEVIHSHHIYPNTHRHTQKHTHTFNSIVLQLPEATSRLDLPATRGPGRGGTGETQASISLASILQ